MTREDIVQMSATSGIAIYGMGKDREKFINHLEKFTKLVAQHERKECEKIIWDADAWIGSDAKIWLVKSIQEERGQA